MAGLDACEAELNGLGYGVRMCFTDFGETAGVVVEEELKGKRFDCVMIGAGVRANPANFLLFEKLVNVQARTCAAGARFVSIQLPSDTAEAVKRWV